MPVAAKASGTYLLEFRLEGELLDVDEVVAGLAVGAGVAEAAELHDAGRARRLRQYSVRTAMVRA